MRGRPPRSNRVRSGPDLARIAASRGPRRGQICPAQQKAGMQPISSYRNARIPRSKGQRNGFGRSGLGGGKASVIKESRFGSAQTQASRCPSSSSRCWSKPTSDQERIRRHSFANGNVVASRRRASFLRRLRNLLPSNRPAVARSNGPAHSGMMRSVAAAGDPSALAAVWGKERMTSSALGLLRAVQRPCGATKPVTVDPG